jgi:predicted nucleotidyltransferase
MAYDVLHEKERIIRVLDALFPGIKIYLFGSRARGTNRENSDVDLALDLGRPLELDEMGQIRQVLDVLYVPVKIDLVDLCRAQDPFRTKILKEAIAWKS